MHIYNIEIAIEDFEIKAKKQKQYKIHWSKLREKKTTHFSGINSIETIVEKIAIIEIETNHMDMDINDVTIDRYMSQMYAICK